MKIYENTSSLDNLIDKTLKDLKTIIDNKTIFGDEIVTNDGTVIIPVSKATIGFVVGGGEYADLSTRRVGAHYPMAGGSSGGICLTPIGFLINTKNEIKYISTCECNNYQKMFDNISNISEFIIEKLIKKGENNKK
ncbi:MAG: GerW family sporulation protein [Clostridia bacterium]|nr:GerW family sporulation protein [Clostridia bacterium]